MKKMLLQIGIYLGIFVVLNVGMFFLLKMTQPKSAVLDTTLHSDSSAVHGLDSAFVLDDQEFDQAPESSDEINGNVVGDSQHDSLALAKTPDHSSDLVQNDHPTSSNKATTMGSEGTDANSDDGLVGDEDELDSPAITSDEVTTDNTPKSTAEISKLAKLLEGMKPDEAAVIAERLPTETIVQLVMRMKSRNGAKMMASLPVPVAASVATRMAELSGVKNPS